MVNFSDIIKDWFDSWGEKQSKFSFCQNIKGNWGIAAGGFMVIIINDDKLEKMFEDDGSMDRGKVIMAADPLLFDKLKHYLMVVYPSLEKRSWI